MDHRWLCAWLELIAPEADSHVLLLRRGDEVAGFAPLVLTRGRELFPSRAHAVHTLHDYRHMRVRGWLRWAPVRRLGFALSVALAHRRGGFLFPGDAADLYAATARYIASIASDWDLLSLEGFARGSSAETRLLDALRACGLRDDGRSFARVTRSLRLPPSLDAFTRTRSQNFRRSLRRARLRNEAAAGAHAVRLVEYRGADLAAGLERLFALEARSWKASARRKRVFHVGPSPELRAFHTRVAHAFGEHGALVLTLEFGAQPVAAIHCLARDAVMVAVVTFLDEARAGQISAMPLFERLVEIAIARGFDEIDFNGDTAAIARWASHARESSRHVLHNSHPYSRFLYLLTRGAHRAHRSLHCLAPRGGDRARPCSGRGNGPPASS